MNVCYVLLHNSQIRSNQNSQTDLVTSRPILCTAACQRPQFPLVTAAATNYPVKTVCRNTLSPPQSVPVYVRACDLDQSFSFDTTVKIKGRRFPIHVLERRS